MNSAPVYSVAKNHRAAGAPLPGKQPIRLAKKPATLLTPAKVAHIGDPVLEVMNDHAGDMERTKIAEMLGALTSDEVPVVERAILGGMDPAAALTGVLQKRAEDPYYQFPEEFRNDMAIAEGWGRELAMRDVLASIPPADLPKYAAALIAAGEGPRTLEEATEFGRQLREMQKTAISLAPVRLWAARGLRGLAKWIRGGAKAARKSAATAATKATAAVAPEVAAVAPAGWEGTKAGLGSAWKSMTPLQQAGVGAGLGAGGAAGLYGAGSALFGGRD